MQRYSKCVFPKQTKLKFEDDVVELLHILHTFQFYCVCIQKNHILNRIYSQISMQSTIGKTSEIIHKEIHPSNLNRNERKEKSVEVFDKKLFLKVVCS